MAVPETEFFYPRRKLARKIDRSSRFAARAIAVRYKFAGENLRAPRVQPKHRSTDIYSIRKTAKSARLAIKATQKSMPSGAAVGSYNYVNLREIGNLRMVFDQQGESQAHTIRTMNSDKAVG